MGIADGDGYERRPFLFKAEDFVRDCDKLRAMGAEGLRKYLFSSQVESTQVLAIGSGKAGRFKTLNARMALPLCTTSVAGLADLTRKLLGTTGPSQSAPQGRQSVGRLAKNRR